MGVTGPILDSGEASADELKPGTELLRGQYRISRMLSSGGFGITYLATDSLDRPVVIKECFPRSMCLRRGGHVRARTKSTVTEFETIVQLFVVEARRLAKLVHPNIVGVHQVFEDNATAYMALDLVRGRELLSLAEAGRPDPETVKAMLLKLLDAVEHIHKRNILHRDIAPDNILVTEEGEPILIDFGAARDQAIRGTRLLSSLHTVKDGYSPYEFYVAGNSQGPYSDLYALAATFYHLITGAAPPDSQSRVAAVAEGRNDPFVPLSTHEHPFDRHFVGAMNDALALFPKDRLQSAEDWVTMIHAEKRIAAAQAAAMRDKMIDVAISRLVTETNRDVLAPSVGKTEPQAAAPSAGGAQPKKKRRRTGKAGPPAERAAPTGAMPRRSAPPSPSKPAPRRGGLRLGLPLTSGLVRFVLRRLFGTRLETR